MSLKAGDKLGPYEIISPIGKGGMGEVYSAHDPRTGRDVAIKISAERFSERFDREVRAVAALNHPNICTLYDVGPNYLVMELVEGESPQGPLPLEEALRIARQIAAALEEAHEKGIVHRDLKPGNIKIKPDGSVKVLDFGLAKIGSGTSRSARLRIGRFADHQHGRDASGRDPGHRRLHGARAGPRQNRRQARRYLGLRSRAPRDVDWASGCFKEKTSPKRSLRWSKKSPTWRTPRLACVRYSNAACRRTPGRGCATSATRWRWSTWLPRRDPEFALAPPPSRSPFILAAVAAGLLAIGLGILAFVHFREQPPPPPEPIRFQISTPALATGNAFYMTMSPDGRKMAYTAVGSDGVNRLWIRSMDTLESRVVAGTEGALSPFWSPDSRFIGYGDGTKLKKVDAAGDAPPQTLCESPTPVGTGTWNADGVIIFGGRGAGPMQRVSASGGTPTAVTTLASGDAFHTYPVFLPDGKHFVYLRSGNQETRGIYAGSLDNKPNEQPSKRLLANQFGAMYVPAAGSGIGHLLFLRESTLMAQPFDPGKQELTGEAVPVAEQVGSAGSGGYFAASAGALAYRAGGGTGRQFTWYDRKGMLTGTVGGQAALNEIELSPDGTRVVSFQDDAQQDLWLFDFARAANTRFTFEAGADRYPVWSPDGNQIAYTSASESTNLFRKPSNGAGDAELLLKSPEPKYPQDWSRDGRYLLYAVNNAKTNVDLWVLPLEGDRKPAAGFGHAVR